MKTICLICGKKGNNKKATAFFNGKEVASHVVCSNPECKKKFWEDYNKQMKETNKKEKCKLVILKEEK